MMFEINKMGRYDSGGGKALQAEGIVSSVTPRQDHPVYSRHVPVCSRRSKEISVPVAE